MKHVSKIILASALATVFASATVFADIKAGGFVDAQYDMYMTTPNASGFNIADAAITISKDLDGSAMMFALPFYSVSGTNFLTVDLFKAQAWVSNTYTDGWSWQLGQFAKIWGNEGIYTVDTSFTRLSRLTTQIFGYTQEGLVIGHSQKSWSVKAVVGNNPQVGNNGNGVVYPTGTGSAPSGSGTLIGANGPELGLRFDLMNDNFTGHLAGDLRMQAAGAANSDYFGELGVGFGSAKSLKVDIDFALKSFTFTGTGWGASGTFGYMLSDKTNLNLRAEYLNAVPESATSLLGGTGATPDQKNVFEATVGPQFKMTKDLNVTVDYTLTSASYNSGASVTAHSLALSGCYHL